MSLLLTQLVPPDTTHILRAPLFARLPDRLPAAWQARFDPPNLLLTTLQVVHLTPVLVDQPTGGARPPAKPFDPPNLLLTTLAPPPVVPYDIIRSPLFARLPDPRPTARQEYVANLLPLYAAPVVTFTISLLDKFDWPSPALPRTKAAGEPAVGPSAPLYTPNPPQPFNQDLWEGAASARAKAVGEPIGRVSPLLTPNPATPFNQYEWRTTARVPISLKSDVYWGAFSLYSPNPPQPFNQDLWESAALPRPKAGGEATPLPLVDYQPFSQDLWENAALPRSKAIGEAVAGVAPLLTPNPAQPFVQSDWFQIRSTQKARVDEPFNLTIYLPVVSVTFTISLLDQFNWPLPARPLPKQADTSIAASAPLYTPNPPQPFNQDIWDSATPAKAKAGGEATGTLSPVLTPNPAQPFVQSVWDLAIRGFPKVVGEAVGTLSPILTPNPASPFNQYEWRNTARIPLSLKSDSYFGAFSLYSPNPPIPFNQNLWENAARTPPRAIGEPVAGISALLTPNPAQPFVQSDWFQIRSTQKAKVDEPFNLTIYLPTVVVTFTISLLDQFNWPLPARGVAPKQTDTSVAPSSPLYFPNPAQPFSQKIWDSATRSYPKVVGEVVGTLSPILTPNPAQPFSQKIWDSATLPKPKAYADPLAAISALYNPNPSRPFSQYQWDSATRAWPKSVGESGGGILALLAPNPANPFNQSDWTRILTTNKAKVDDFTNLVPLYSVVVPPRFFHQDDWSTVARAAAAQKSDSYRGPNALLTPNPSRPFHQDLWELPTQLPRLKSIGDVLASPNPIIFPNPSRPFRQGDWPSNARTGPSDRSFAAAVNLPLAVPPIPPPPTIGVSPMIGAYPKWRMLGSGGLAPVIVQTALVSVDSGTVVVGPDGSSVVITIGK